MVGKYNENSVQAELNNAIGEILQETVMVVGAGRTDAGVHAKQMFAHFDTNKELNTSFVYKFNAVLPHDIVIHQISKWPRMLMQDLML